MKKISFKHDKNGKIQAVEDPNGQWRLHSLPDGGTALLSPLPPGFIGGIDPSALGHKCDLCDKVFTHDPLPVADENFKVQAGIISCGCHIYTEEDE